MVPDRRQASQASYKGVYLHRTGDLAPSRFGYRLKRYDATLDTKTTAFALYLPSGHLKPSLDARRVSTLFDIRILRLPSLDAAHRWIDAYQHALRRDGPDASGPLPDSDAPFAIQSEPLHAAFFPSKIEAYRHLLALLSAA